MSTAVLTEVVVVEVAEHVGVVLTALLLVILLVIGGSILAGGLRLLVEGQVRVTVSPALKQPRLNRQRTLILRVNSRSPLR